MNRAQRRRLAEESAKAQWIGQALIEAANPRVCFATITGGLITAELFGTFVHCVTKDQQTNHYIDNFICKKSGGLLSVFRNGVVAEFLEDTTSDWLWMVDSDIALQDDTLDVLMDAARAHPKAQIISGWYVLPMEDGNWPCTFHWNGDNFSYTPVPSEIQYVDSVGVGCVMVSRKLLLAMKDKYGLPSPWFTLTERLEDKEKGITPRVFGEDHSFFMRTMFDFHQRPLLVPQAEVGHVKTHLLTGEDVSAF